MITHELDMIENFLCDEKGINKQSSLHGLSLLGPRSEK